MECWAKDISQCIGPQSGEHYVSKGLFEKSGVKMKGLPFCGDELVEIPLSGLKANILCKRHNELLAPLDAEAKRLKDSVLWDATSSQAPPGSTQIDGWLFARWMAKTYCNFMTLGKQPLDPDFARFAFDREPSSKYRGYAWFPMFREAKQLGLVQSTPEDHFQFNYFHDRPAIVVYIRFFGLRFVLANIDCKKFSILEFGDQLTIDVRDLDTPSRFVLRRNLGGGQRSAQYEILLDWTESTKR